jgi:serine/threonine protein kinase
MKICSVCKRCFEDAAEACVEVGHPQLAEARGGHPQMVPGYELERLAGTGTNASTYRARRIDCGQFCYIQIVSADARSGEAFLRDAQLAAMLLDTGFVCIYESGSLESGEYFAVTEDAQAQTLREHLDATGIPDLLTSIRIIEKTAEVLHAIHLKGLIHGAVRPENILLAYDSENRPQVRVGNVDLGGVVARNTLSNKFVIDNSVAAIRYFAPEQCSGEPTTPRTDIYSLGIVFHELLTGAPPFDAPKAVALMGMHINTRPPDVSVDDFELRMLVTHSLSEALQKQPNSRQSSANLVARQMRHMEQLATHVSTPPPAGEAPPQQRRPEPQRPVAAKPPVVIEPAVAEPTVSIPQPVLSERYAPEVPQMASHRVETQAPVRAAPIDLTYKSAPEFIPIENEAFAADAYVLAAEPESVPDPEPRAVVTIPEPETLPIPQPETAPVPEPAPILIDEVKDVPAVPPHGVIHSHERSALQTHRHRLRTFKKRSEPAGVDQPLQIEDEHPGPEPPIDPPPARPVEILDLRTRSAAAVEATPPEQPPAHRKLIQWEMPEDDMPSMEDVRAALAEDELNGAPAFTAAEPIAAAVQPTLPRPVDWEPLPEELPQPTARFESRVELRMAPGPALAETRIEPTENRIFANVNAKTDQGGVATWKSGTGQIYRVELIRDAPSTIDTSETVTAPRRPVEARAVPKTPAPLHKADTDRRVPPRRIEVSFSPTILGEAERRTTTNSKGPISIFTEPENGRRFPSRMLLRGALVLGVSAVFIVLGLAAFNFLGTAWTGSGLSEEVSAAPPKAHTPARPATAPSATNNDAELQSKPVRLLPPERSTSDVPEVGPKSSPVSTAPKPVGKADVESSSKKEVRSRVRSNTQVERADRNQKPERLNSQERTPPATRKNSVGATRPRIVSVP